MNPFEVIRKWMSDRANLLKELERLKLENQQLRERVADLQRTRDLAQQSVQERRREKEVLRKRLAAQKKEVAEANLAAKQAAARATELRDENDKLRSKQKR